MSLQQNYHMPMKNRRKEIAMQNCTVWKEMKYYFYKLLGVKSNNPYNTKCTIQHTANTQKGLSFTITQNKSTRRQSWIICTIFYNEQISWYCIHDEKILILMIFIVSFYAKIQIVIHLPREEFTIFLIGKQVLYRCRIIIFLKHDLPWNITEALVAHDRRYHRFQNRTFGVN
jgi:hypothetical protein